MAAYGEVKCDKIQHTSKSTGYNYVFMRPC